MDHVTHVACLGRASPSGREELVLMVLDVVEESLNEFTRCRILERTIQHM